jgi:hypothetical protein
MNDKMMPSEAGITGAGSHDQNDRCPQDSKALQMLPQAPVITTHSGLYGTDKSRHNISEQ